jgi:FKBP-type peptidyl-prolyl cis-trans isomerase
MKSILRSLFIFTILLTGCGKNDCDQEPNLDVDDPRLQNEIAAVDSYLSGNGIDATEHPSGIRYVVASKGSGASPTLCDNVVVSYEGRLMSNGIIFDSNPGNPRSFALSNLIVGWQIGIPLIKEGGRITLYVPAQLAYGEREVGDIPANSNLIFEIVLFNVQ